MLTSSSTVPAETSDLRAARADRGGSHISLATSSLACWLSWLACLLASGCLILSCYNHFWTPVDDGAYAHVAQRVLAGEVLHRDIQDVHAGYINFTNALWLYLFGLDLVSLRYPLAAMSLVQSLLVWQLFRASGPGAAFAAGLTTAALGFIQFNNPTAHWYCAFLMTLVISVLTSWSPEDSRRGWVLGFLLGLTFLFRQLSGVFLAIGTLTALFAEHRTAGSSQPMGPLQQLVPRVVSLTMAAGLCAYLFPRCDATTVVVFGLGPLALTLAGAIAPRLSNGEALRVLCRLAGGALLAAAPLLGYHLLQGSLGVWLEDTILAATSLSQAGFISQVSFLGTQGELAIWPEAARVALSATSWSERASGLFWWLLVAAHPLAGLVALRSTFDRRQCSPFLIVGVCYSLVSLHYQIFVYLIYSAGLMLLCASLPLLSGPRLVRWGAMAVLLAVSAVGVRYHACQPLTRGWHGIIRGVRTDNQLADSLPRCSLWIDGESLQTHRRLLKRIEQETEPDDYLGTLPGAPQLHFLSGRKNLWRFFNSSLGLRGTKDVATAVDRWQETRPRLLLVDPHDKYFTPLTAELLSRLQPHYDHVPPVAGFDVYRLRDNTSAATPAAVAPPLPAVPENVPSNDE